MADLGSKRSSRPSSKINSQSPVPKRARPESPIEREASPASTNVCIEDDDESENVVVDYTAGDMMEEVVVTVDDTGISEEIGPEIETDADSLLVPVTTVSVPGGALLSDLAEPNLPEKPSPAFVFKDHNFIHSSKGPGGTKKTRIWKNLKQIVAAERSLAWQPTDVTYGSIDAPPSFKPAKKYSDISGLEARYTDPQTKMRFANADEYRRVRMLPGDIISGCLQLRKAKTLVP